MKLLVEVPLEVPLYRRSDLRSSQCESTTDPRVNTSTHEQKGGGLTNQTLEPNPHHQRCTLCTDDLIEPRHVFIRSLHLMSSKWRALIVP